MPDASTTIQHCPQHLHPNSLSTTSPTVSVPCCTPSPRLACRPCALFEPKTNKSNPLESLLRLSSWTRPKRPIGATISTSIGTLERQIRLRSLSIVDDCRPSLPGIARQDLTRKSSVGVKTEPEAGLKSHKSSAPATNEPCLHLRLQLQHSLQTRLTMVIHIIQPTKRTGPLILPITL